MISISLYLFILIWSRSLSKGNVIRYNRNEYAAVLSYWKLVR